MLVLGGSRAGGGGCLDWVTVGRGGGGGGDACIG